MEYGIDKDEPEFILATTALAHTFCRNHLNCKKFNEIQRIVTFLESNLQNNLDRIGEAKTEQERVTVNTVLTRMSKIMWSFTGTNST